MSAQIEPEVLRAAIDLLIKVEGVIPGEYPDLIVDTGILRRRLQEMMRAATLDERKNDPWYRARFTFYQNLWRAARSEHETAFRVYPFTAAGTEAHERARARIVRADEVFAELEHFLETGERTGSVTDDEIMRG